MHRAAPPLCRRATHTLIKHRHACQWPMQQKGNKVFSRMLADTVKSNPTTKPSIHDSDAVVLPGSQSQTATEPTPLPPGAINFAPARPTSDSDGLPEKLPLVPPPPSGVKIQTTPPSTIPPPTIRTNSPKPPATPSLEIADRGSQSPPPPPRKKPRRLRRFLLTLVILSGLAYAGGVWYSLISDNFHDFFTEYVPFGEDSVLYFEEREFRRRFPNATKPTNRPTTPRDSGNKITIPSKSGLSWKVHEKEEIGSDLASKGRHMSALEDNKPSLPEASVQQTPPKATAPEKIRAVEKAKTDAPPPPANKPEPQPIKATLPESKHASNVQYPVKSEKPASKPAATEAKGRKDIQHKSPEVNEPSIFVPITRIDPLKIKNANEPLVQDLVKIVNDIITVVNADNASGKYLSTINKAKSALSEVGRRIVDLKIAGDKSAEEKIRSTQTDFDKAARELVRRLEEEMRDQETRWKEEFESEREKLSQSYQERLQSEVERFQQVSEQRAVNQLLEQAITIKKQFMSDVKDHVETERNGRLAKLSDLSTCVTELEDLTCDWNSAVDANLKTQHLQVAVEAVRSSLENADRPRPFIKELAALKELACDDPVVNAAIASISPMAYQRGVLTSPQLIDRFRRVAFEARKASLLPEDAGVASHAASLLLSKIMFKKQGMAVGDDVESVLTRTESLLEEGNLNDAAREVNGLSGWAKTLSGDWLAEARRVLEVRQAMDVISTQARLQGLKVD